ncbi:unnamed protein product [Phaedon cochleariae]|uniref:CAP-Gly domain-containing protein n=1 Tax=Phaedon cochleariae TaxID=80249 RepID=A0A9N9SBB6_PHACE|nr:unnamed protein product [Phaedon cochleariae]
MECNEGQNGKELGLETVRALHQTVVALRAALEESKTVISELRSKSWPIEAVQQALQALSIENHVLRRKLLDADGLMKIDKASGTKYIPTTEDESISKIVNNQKIDFCPTEKHSEIENNPATFQAYSQPKPKKVTIISPKLSPKKSSGNLEARITVKTKTLAAKKLSRSLESLTVIKSPLESSNQFSFTKTVSFSNLSNKITRGFKLHSDKKTNMSEENRNMKERTENGRLEEHSEEPLSPQNDLDQNEEVDDIELIFTTDDTKDSDFKEHLVSIDPGEATQPTMNLLQLALSEVDPNLETSDRELEDDVFNDNFDNENQENANISFDFKRENSQLYDSKSDNSINQEKSMKSYYSFQDSSFENRSLEKDESFDRFEERIRIVETDISKCGIQDIDYTGGRRNTCPNPIQYRPLLHREAMSKVSRKSRPILTHSNAVRKESEAQTDISAIPGSSWRSESSLASKARLGDNFTTLPSKYPLPGSRLRLSEKTVEARRVLLSDIGFTSMVPELSRSADHLFPPNIKMTGTTPNYGQFLKTSDLYSPAYTCPQSQKFTWTTTATATPSEGSRCPSTCGSAYPFPSPPAPARRCSAPVSPSHRPYAGRPPPINARVRFANGSLPELRGEWATGADSGDSTDSLVDEAEHYLRRSIDCITSGRDSAPAYSQSRTKSVLRRASAPEPAGDNVPPAGWLPFLPRAPRDLKPDHWAKVITAEGRVRGGRVRYVGPVGGQRTETQVGVQLSAPDGYCDGAVSNRRYFQCEPYHGIFVPFKKVIMGWRP